MKAIILAAGRGTRMGSLTEGLPKGMLSVEGKSLIERQLEVLGQIGIKDIVVVTGYQSEKIPYKGVRYYHNAQYATTNMVESLICARAEMTEDILVAYSDIVYSPALAQLVVSSHDDIGVAVDEAWRDYWMQRYGSTETDLESLQVDNSGRIIEIGLPVNSSVGLNHRYIGLLKFSRRGIREILSVYDRKNSEQSPWPQSGKSFKNGYMTDLLSESINAGFAVKAIVSKRGWVEFDTVEDYEVGSKCLMNIDIV